MTISQPWNLTLTTSHLAVAEINLRQRQKAKPEPIGPLLVETMANGGTGIVRHEGRVIFVPQVVPGDEIICRIHKLKKRFAEAELVEVVRHSAQRRQTPCSIADRCGGCQWQQLLYAEQLRWKEQLFYDTLTRNCSVNPNLLRPIVAASNEWNYRSRVQVKCCLTDDGFICGFFMPKSHFVVSMKRCPVIAEPLNELLNQLRTLLADSAFAGQISQIDLSIDDLLRRCAVIHYGGVDLDEFSVFLRSLVPFEDADLLIQSNRSEKLILISGRGELTIKVDEPILSLNYAAGGFAQINLEQNRQLVAAVINAANLSGQEMVLDLFCGMGNFSLPLARRAKQLHGVEDYAPSIEMARQNAKINQLDNVEFHTSSAEGALTRLGKEISFDLVLLDPPRSGAAIVMEELVKIPVSRVIYVSCDAQTMARDLNILQAGNYRTVSSQPFDMFPQTHHVESLTILEYCE